LAKNPGLGQLTRQFERFNQRLGCEINPLRPGRSFWSIRATTSAAGNVINHPVFSPRQTLPGEFRHLNHSAEGVVL
jgi:hypothetical protein